MKMFNVKICNECELITEIKETNNYNDCTYMCNEELSYLETDLSLKLNKIKPSLSICDVCAKKVGLIKNG